jgi:tRNA threonylcarbamoyladenosine biosynthesis protein TsaE
MQHELYLQGEQAMEQFGAALGRALPVRALVFLVGDLGMGKTTLARGILRGRGHAGSVKSPTYTLVEPYLHLVPPLYHFDLYRLADPEELEYLGMRDYLEEEAQCLVEWPERAGDFLPTADLIITIEKQNSGRRLCLSGDGALATAIASAVAEQGGHRDSPGAAV